MNVTLTMEGVINSVTTHVVHSFVDVEKDTYSMETVSTAMVSSIISPVTSYAGHTRLEL